MCLPYVRDYFAVSRDLFGSYLGRLPSYVYYKDGIDFTDHQVMRRMTQHETDYVKLKWLKKLDVSWWQVFRNGWCARRFPG